MLQHFHEYDADFLLDDLVDRVLGKAAVFLLQLLDPVCMLAKLLIVPDITSTDHGALQMLQLIF